MVSPSRMKRFQQLESKRNSAAKQLRDALESRWPEKSIIKVFLNCKQAFPSDAEVINHNGQDGTVRVRLVKANKRGLRHVCNVHFARVSQQPGSATGRRNNMSTRKKSWRRNYQRELEAVTQPGSLHPGCSEDGRKHTCSHCLKVVSGYVPRGGDGSALRLRKHKAEDGITCHGSYGLHEC